MMKEAVLWNADQSGTLLYQLRIYALFQAHSHSHFRNAVHASYAIA